MAQEPATVRRVKALIKEPIDPLGSDTDELLRPFQPNLDSEFFEPRAAVLDPGGFPHEITKITNAVKQTLEVFRIGIASEAPALEGTEPALRRRLRDASRHLCDVIDVLDVLGGDANDVKMHYELLVEIAEELHMSVFEVQARSVA